MKKPLLFLALAAAVAFASCSDDDDDKNCDSCTLQGEKLEICDNGDGTYTLSGGGESETIDEADLQGVSTKEFVDALCSLEDLAQ